MKGTTPMRKYMYLLCKGGIPAPFDGPLDQSLARQQAEKQYGTDGELYVLLPQLPEPGAVFNSTTSNIDR